MARAAWDQTSLPGLKYSLFHLPRQLQKVLWNIPRLIAPSFCHSKGRYLRMITMLICADYPDAEIEGDGTPLAMRLLQIVRSSEAPMTASSAQPAAICRSSPGSERPILPKRDTSMSRDEANAMAVGSARAGATWPIFVLCLGGVLTVMWSLMVGRLIWLAVQTILF
jgi:hypothetical protein